MERYLPLPEAAKRLHINSSDLFQLIETGKMQISMITTNTGEILMNEIDIQAQLPREDQPEYKKYSSLKGIGIGIREGARKYNLSHQTISQWVEKGYLRSLGTIPVRGGQKLLVDEADLAYCSEIYHRNPGQGKRIFGPNGGPYQKK